MELSIMKDMIIIISLILKVVYSCDTNTNNTLLRLYGMSSSVVGGLQLCINGSWSDIVNENDNNVLTLQDSIVVCRSLGYQSAAQLQYERLLETTTPISCFSSTGLLCTGTETQLSQCDGYSQLSSINCRDHVSDWSSTVITFCKDPIPGEVRLIGSTINNEGIVEVYNSYYGWSTIGTDNWDDNDANVICHSLGYDDGEKSLKTYSFLDLPLKRYNKFYCDGDEDSIFDCKYDGPYPEGCYTASPARLSCSNKDDYNYSVLVEITLSIQLLMIFSIIVIILFIACYYTRKRLTRSPQTINNIAGDNWSYRPMSPPPSYV